MALEGGVSSLPLCLFGFRCDLGSIGFVISCVLDKVVRIEGLYSQVLGLTLPGITYLFKGLISRNHDKEPQKGRLFRDKVGAEALGFRIQPRCLKMPQALNPKPQSPSPEH